MEKQKLGKGFDSKVGKRLTEVYYQSVTDCFNVPADKSKYIIDMDNQPIKNAKIVTAYDKHQVETATVEGVITTAGDLTVIVTATGMEGSPKTISVAVEVDDDASITAGKIRSVLQLDEEVSTLFEIGGEDTDITLTKIEASANDANFNISIADGTCVGITTAATSDNTIAGGTTDKTIEFINVIGSGDCILSISLFVDYAVTNAITYPNSVVWQSSAPSLVEGKKYIIDFVSYDNGTTWLGLSNGAW